MLWNALLGILEDGMLTLGDTTTTDFTRSIIIMTSNVGSRQMGEILEQKAIGFEMSEGSRVSAIEPSTLSDAALSAAREHFPYEFLNRFDETLVYSALNQGDLSGIFQKFLDDIRRRMVSVGLYVQLKVSSKAKSWIIEKGTDLRFGARPLRRAIESGSSLIPCRGSSLPGG